jgi:glycosyltransferase involved in cell wall biosynthesis
MRTALMASACHAAGHSVTWVTSSFSHTQKSFRQVPGELTFIPEFNIVFLRALGYQKNISVQRYLDDRALVQSFVRFTEETVTHPDLIIASMPSVGLARAAVNFANEAMIPVIVDIRDLYPDVFSSYAPPILRGAIRLASLPMRKSVKRLLKKSDAIMSISADFLEWGKKLSDSSDKKSFYVPMAYPSLESSENNSQLLRDKYISLSNEYKLKLIFIGTLSRSFDFATLFEVAKKCDVLNLSASFTFCGTGYQSDFVEKNCKELRNCSFLGWVDSAAIASLLDICDVGIAPYINVDNFKKNLPNKPIEYLSGGMAVVTSLQEGPLVDIIEGNNVGSCYSNADDLVNYIKSLLRNINGLEVMSNTAKQIYMRDYSAENVYKDLVSTLESFSSNKKRHSV